MNTKNPLRVIKGVWSSCIRSGGCSLGTRLMNLLWFIEALAEEDHAIADKFKKFMSDKVRDDYENEQGL